MRETRESMSRYSSGETSTRTRIETFLQVWTGSYDTTSGETSTRTRIETAYTQPERVDFILRAKHPREQGLKLVLAGYLLFGIYFGRNIHENKD